MNMNVLLIDTHRDGKYEWQSDAGNDDTNCSRGGPSLGKRAHDESVPVNGDPQNAQSRYIDWHGKRAEDNSTEYLPERPPVSELVMKLNGSGERAQPQVGDGQTSDEYVSGDSPQPATWYHSVQHDSIGKYSYGGDWHENTHQSPSDSGPT